MAMVGIQVMVGMQATVGIMVLMGTEHHMQTTTTHLTSTILLNLRLNNLVLIKVATATEVTQVIHITRLLLQL